MCERERLVVTVVVRLERRRKKDGYEEKTATVVLTPAET